MRIKTAGGSRQSHREMGRSLATEIVLEFAEQFIQYK